MKESEQPKTTLDDVLSELKGHRVKKKDFWDRLVPEAIIISCVIPPLLGTLEGISRKYFHLDPLIVDAGVKTGIEAPPGMTALSWRPFGMPPAWS